MFHLESGDASYRGFSKICDFKLNTILLEKMDSKHYDDSITGKQICFYN